MKNEKLRSLAELGQSIWLDTMARSLMTEGTLAEYVQMGVRGMTTNPAIFQKAIADGTAYDADIARLARADKPTPEIYEALVVKDIQLAADLLRPIYDAARPDFAELDAGDDGYVSLEVDPHLAHQSDESIEEARRLFSAVDRPNVMIKIPATDAGMVAIEQLTADGINVNVTLLFSVEQYDQVAAAYMRGLEKRAARGDDLSGIASVASFFVSRVDVLVDQLLSEIDRQDALPLQGQTGIANAKLAYQRFKQAFTSERFARLADQGARVQRVLYGSTSTKNPAYSDTLYPDNLIGRQTVNTLPLDTFEAFLDHGTVSPTLEQGLPASRAQLDSLSALGIDFDAVTNRLLDEGIEKFVQPFAALLDMLEEQRRKLLARNTETAPAQ